MYTAKKSSVQGLTLPELLLFMVIVAVAVSGVLLVLNVTTRSSSDPMIRKQALAIAESLLEEVQLMPFTYCDPTDANFATANAPADCATPAGQETIPGGPEANETRYGPVLFNNVNDYNGFRMTGIRDLTNVLIPGLGFYSASVNIQPSSIGGIPASESALITVTVDAPFGTEITLQGYRTRYAPNG